MRIFSNNKTSNCKKASLFYFAVVIVTLLFIATSMPLKPQSHQAYNIQDALAQLHSPPSQSQLVSKKISLQTLPVVSPPSINNTNITAKEFLSGINITQMIGPYSQMRQALSKVAIDIPLQKGYENGNEIYFVTFDASNNGLALQITNSSIDFPIHYTKLLAQTPPEATEEAYIFTNGINGKGHFDYQPTIVEAKPGDKEYSPLKHVNLVEWKTSSSVRELKSIKELVNAQNAGEITINTTSPNLVINSPAIKWQDGSLKIREDKVVHDNTPFIGGQVTSIDTEKMVVTMVTMRGYGHDGKTVYWLVTDATPNTDDIAQGGIVYAPKDELLAYTPVAVDFYQFVNGIRDAGPQGFQPPISPVNLEDEYYSPMWRISFVVWKDPQQAKILQTMADLIEMKKEGLIETIPVFQGKHIVNCPFFDQETVLKFRHNYKQ